MNYKFFLVSILIITFLGGFLRFDKITQNPPELNGDEMSFGYSAYSILQTGRDEYGKFMPLTFQSVGDYKNPVPVYLMLIPIKILGLNELSVRFPNALISTLTIPLFFIFLNKILKNKRSALVGSFLLAISSWHIYYSRFSYEPLMASTFVFLGIWFFIKMIDGKYYWGLLSAFFLILTMYTSFAPRLFVPLFVFFALIYNIPKFKENWGRIGVFILVCIILALPLMYVSIFQGASTRFGMVFISSDIEFSRYILLKHFQSLGDVPLLVLFWVKRYLNYLQPEFLFFNGLNMTHPGNIGLGMLYLFELPWLILGAIDFMKNKIPYKGILIIWLLTGLIPDSITNNQQHAGRLLHITPVIYLLITLGVIKFIQLINTSSRFYVKVTALGIFSVFVLLNLIHAFLIFTVHFPRAKGEFFDEGVKEVSMYINEHQENYEEIVFDTRRGIESSSLVINPHVDLLFYLKYDPSTYQSEEKQFGTSDKPFYKFNKYAFREIKWGEDKNKKQTLFIASPWAFPEKDLKEGEILHKVIMTNGYPAYLIVSPRIQ